MSPLTLTSSVFTNIVLQQFYKNTCKINLKSITDENKLQGLVLLVGQNQLNEIAFYMNSWNLKA